MSVISWDNVNNPDISLTEKQLESVYALSSLDLDYDYTKTDPTLDNDLKSQKENDLKIEKTSMQLASHFYSWLWSLEQTRDSEILPAQNFIDSKKKECSEMLNTVDTILLDLTFLEQNYLSISLKTNELHELCEHLLRQQNELSESALFIEKRLVYFINVDAIQSALTVTNFIVSREKLLPIFDKLDSSIIYFKENMHYQESSVYLTRAKSVLLKALNIVKSNVIMIVTRTINELTELHDVISPENSFILLYGRFRSQGQKIRPMISLLEDRVHITDEYLQIITECHTFYLENREKLLTPVATNGVNDLVEKYSGDHFALLRTAGAFMSNMCEDEMRLFNQFFSVQFSTSITRMLSQLCRCLHNAIRPLIIHINHFEILSELCDILKYELIQENITDTRPDIVVFSELRDMLLADVQERLIFRSHIYIKSQILNYIPSPGDLTYPEKLEMMDTISKLTLIKQEGQTNLSGEKDQSEPKPIDSGSENLNNESSNDLAVTPGLNMSLAPADLHGMWYPTMRRALLCLSKLSRCLDSNSFRGLAQECVSACVQSLIIASDSITQRSRALDGQLFLIKHLLILREQMAPFNVEFLIKETSLDFSPYKNMAFDIWEQKGLGFFVLNRHNALLRFLLETPNAVDVEVDSRRQLDSQLKYICELLIEQQVLELTGELSNFMKRANTVLSVLGAKLYDQEFAHVSLVKEMISNSHRKLCVALGRKGRHTTKQCEDTTPKFRESNLHRSLGLYLANPDTEHILMRRIQCGVLNCWKSIYQLLVDHYTEEDRMIVACPNESQIRLLFQDLWAIGMSKT